MAITRYIGSGSSAGFGTAGLNGLFAGQELAANQQDLVRNAIVNEQFALGVLQDREAQQQFFINQQAGLNPLQNRAQIFQSSPYAGVSDQNLVALLANTAALTPAAQGAAAAGDQSGLGFLGSGIAGALGTNAGIFKNQNPTITSGLAGQGGLAGFLYNQQLGILNGLAGGQGANNPNGFFNQYNRYNYNIPDTNANSGIPPLSAITQGPPRPAGRG